MIDFDTADMEAMHARVLRALEQIPDILFQEAKEGAFRARATHPYQNRTGKLSRSTKAHMVRRRKLGGEVTISANTPYAEYVRRRGLMTIDQQGIATGKAIEERLVKLAQ